MIFKKLILFECQARLIINLILNSNIFECQLNLINLTS